MDHLKNAWKSLTIWFNVLSGAFVVNFDAIRDGLPQMQPYLTPALFSKLMFSVVLINIGLRFKTNKALSEK